MANQVQVEIVAVDREVWTGEVDMVLARTVDGEIGILHGHVPLLGALEEGGVVRLMQESGETRVAVHGGFLSVTDEGVQILAELAELESEIDVARAQRQLEENRGASADDPEAMASVRRAEARLRAAGHAV